MISWAWGRRSIGKVRSNRSASSTQPHTICGVSDDVAQVSITSGSAAKPPGWLRCDSSYPAGTVGGGIDRQVGLVGQDRRQEVGDAVGVDRVPDGERHAEEPLPGDVPVADEAVHPVLVADPHEVGPPRQLLAAGQHLVLRRVADEPLLAGDDLERAGAVLPELHRVGDGPDLAVEQPGVGEQLGDAGLGLLGGLAGQLVVGGLGGGRVGRLPARLAPGDRAQTAVALDDGADRQRQLPPPRDVGGVAERADHRHARALLGVGQRVGDERDGHAEQRGDDRLAEHRLVALVVGVGDHRHARGEELGPGRVDQQGAVRAR